MAHVLYRSCSSSFQDLQKNVNIVIDLLILAAQVFNRADSMQYGGVIPTAEGFTDHLIAVRGDFLA